MNKTLITVVGPTAIGKTSLSLELAQHYNTEILSADSRQFFKEMEIGTAVPTQEELAAAPHHFIQHISIEDTYSVGHYERDALKLLDELFKKHDVLILVGGSGLYVDAVLNGLDQFPEVTTGTREKLEELLKTKGTAELQRLLQEKDPIYFQEVDIQNTQRVMRALEVCISSGKSFSSFRNQPKKPRDFHSIKIGLTADRDTIYDRINRRVDIMMNEGLLEEVKGLLSRKRLNALQTVGYRELFEYLEGDITLENAIENIKTNTRRFAKRQLTWYRKDPKVHWFDYQTPLVDILDYITKNALPT
jgi:tRNA dimethylallyltransferase